MPRTADAIVDCPLCGASVSCWIDPGEPMVMYYRDGSGYPGSPAGLDDFEAECGCYDSVLVNTDKYREAIEERAMNAAGGDYAGPDRLEER